MLLIFLNAVVFLNKQRKIILLCNEKLFFFDKRVWQFKLSKKEYLFFYFLGVKYLNGVFKGYIYNYLYKILYSFIYNYELENIIIYSYELEKMYMYCIIIKLWKYM